MEFPRHTIRTILDTQLNVMANIGSPGTQQIRFFDIVKITFNQKIQYALWEEVLRFPLNQ